MGRRRWGGSQALGFDPAAHRPAHQPAHRRSAAPASCALDGAAAPAALSPRPPSPHRCCQQQLRLPRRPAALHGHPAPPCLHGPGCSEGPGAGPGLSKACPRHVQSRCCRWTEAQIDWQHWPDCACVSVCTTDTQGSPAARAGVRAPGWRWAGAVGAGPWPREAFAPPLRHPAPQHPSRAARKSGSAGSGRRRFRSRQRCILQQHLMASPLGAEASTLGALWCRRRRH